MPCFNFRKCAFYFFVLSLLSAIKEDQSLYLLPAKTLIASNKCDACMLCVKNCPVEAIKWVNDRPFWTLKCESCMRCVNQCPERAIQTAHSFTAFVIYLSTILSSFIFVSWMKKINFLNISNSPVSSEIVWDILVSIVMIIVVFASYRLMHYFMKYRWFCKFIEYTSLSRLKWWRRYRPGKILRNYKSDKSSNMES